jgi:hypothetical protein
MFEKIKRKPADLLRGLVGATLFKPHDSKELWGFVVYGQLMRPRKTGSNIKIPEIIRGF